MDNIRPQLARIIYAFESMSDADQGEFADEISGLADRIENTAAGVANGTVLLFQAPDRTG